MDKTVAHHLPAIKDIFISHGAERAYLFGSAAKGTTNAHSDVDFLFKFPSDMDYVSYANNYFDMLEALESLLKKKVDLIAEETLSNPYLIQKIDSQKIQLL
jgi:predicted nucleotidyltransferase